MNIKITKWLTDSEFLDWGFAIPPDQVLFDSEIFLDDFGRYFSDKIKTLPIYIYDNIYQNKENIIWLQDKLFCYLSQNKITKDIIYQEFDKIAKNLKSQNISDIITNLKDNIYGSFAEDIHISGTKIKKVYVMLFLIMTIKTAGNIFQSSYKPTTKSDISETLAWNKVFQTDKRVKIDIKPLSPIWISSIKFPKPSMKLPSIIMPNTAVTTIDTNWVAKNMLLPDKERIDGTTLCAKTARMAAETIYGSSWFVVKEQYDGDNDAIGYYLRAQENQDKLESEYPLFVWFKVANQITKNKELWEDIRYNLDSLTINPDQFGILVTTQNDSKIKDWHQVLINNMYHADWTVEWTYVYDPYLHKAVKKRYKDLLEEQKSEYIFDSADWYFVPINTYIKFCEYKWRVPLWTMIYNQPKVPAQLITNKKISPEIDIRESHFKQFNDLYSKVTEYISNHKEQLWNDFLETNYIQDLANFSQESKLSPFAINRRGFKWIGQMNNRALQEVYNQYPFIKNDFGDKIDIGDLNLEQMILASKIYKNWVIYKQLANHHDRLDERSIFELVKKDDLSKFTLAAYNRWSNRLSKLIAKYIEETWDNKNISRADFEEYYLKEISNRSAATKFIKWYNGYVELFGIEWQKLWYINSITHKQEIFGEFLSANQYKYNLPENALLSE